MLGAKITCTEVQAQGRGAVLAACEPCWEDKTHRSAQQSHVLFVAAAATAQPVAESTPHAHTQRHKNKPQAAALLRLKTVRAQHAELLALGKSTVLHHHQEK